MPTARSDAIPLAEALHDFLSGLDRVDSLMPSWRIPKTEVVWQRSAHAIRLAREDAKALQQAGTTLGFEQLNARLGDVISPLEELADVAETIRKLR